MQSILAVDVGTTGLKATLVARDGQTLATCCHDYRNLTYTTVFRVCIFLGCGFRFFWLVCRSRYSVDLSSRYIY